MLGEVPESFVGRNRSYTMKGRVERSVNRIDGRCLPVCSALWAASAFGTVLLSGLECHVRQDVASRRSSSHARRLPASTSTKLQFDFAIAVL